MRWQFTFIMMLFSATVSAADPPVVGLIPKATKPIKMDGKLDDWGGAFSTPVHIGHPQFLNRGAEFFYLWDEQNLYIGLRCLDRVPVHAGTDKQLWNGDAVEFYLDTRRDDLGAKEFTAGALHMFYTPFTIAELKPRLAVRDLPHQKDFVLKGAEVVAEKAAWGWTCEFKLPWNLFPKFAPKTGEVIGLECELCSADVNTRVDRTFVFAGPAAVGSPSAFGRIKLVDKLEPADLKTVGRVLLPLNINKSANYDHLYVTAGVAQALGESVAKIDGKILGADGKALKTVTGPRKTLEGSNTAIWTGAFELFDVPHGTYTLELTAFGKDNAVLTSRKVPFLHGDPPAPKKVGQQPSPMVEHARVHERLKNEPPKGQREKLTLGTLFVPESVPSSDSIPLLIHFHGPAWIAETAAAGLPAASITLNLGSGSSTYAKPFADAGAFAKLLEEASAKCGRKFSRVTLSAWSAGYGSVRSILNGGENLARIDSVILLDGLHAGYVDGVPGPKESKLTTDDLEVFVRFAREAAAGTKQLLVTHSEIFPGTFASTTETADYLLSQLEMKRAPTLTWGPLGMQQISEAKRGNFRVLGFAGNSAPDHVDHLHALVVLVKKQ